MEFISTICASNISVFIIFVTDAQCIVFTFHLDISESVIQMIVQSE